MNQNKANIFIINGKEYDAETGLLIGSVSQRQVAKSKSRLHQPVSSSSQVHRGLQRSQALRRGSLSRPEPAIKSPERSATHRQARQLHQSPGSIGRSPMISRFADVTPSVKKPVNSTAQSIPVTRKIVPADRPFKAHPVAERTIQRQHSERKLQAQTKPNQALKSQPASAIKQAVIAEAMSQTSSTKASRSPRPKKQPKKAFRLTSLAGASLAIILLGGYFSYLAMPNLSVRVAAIQSGVDASYPGYKPVGYRLSGPVAYSGGQVSMKFQSNGGPQSFTLTQSNSSWDSTAVETNYVQPDVGDDYGVTKKQGLTIYTYADGKAAWVNKGILYSLSGDAPINSEQIARLATSM